MHHNAGLEVIFYHDMQILFDLISSLQQSDCRIPNWVRAKTVQGSSTNHIKTTTRFRSFFSETVKAMWPKQTRIASQFSLPFKL